MRGRLLALAVGTVLLTAALLSGAQAGAGKKGMKGGMGCPMAVEGAEAQVANIANGVTITITAQDPEAVKKIQETAASHVKDGKFACCCKGGKHKANKCGDCGKDMGGKKVHKCAGCDKDKAEKKAEGK